MKSEVKGTATSKRLGNTALNVSASSNIRIKMGLDKTIVLHPHSLKFFFLPNADVKV